MMPRPRETNTVFGQTLSNACALSADSLHRGLVQPSASHFCSGYGAAILAIDKSRPTVAFDATFDTEQGVGTCFGNAPC